MRWLLILIFIFAPFAAGKAKADPLVLSEQINKFDLTENLTYLRDPDGSLTLDDVAGQAIQHEFVRSNGTLNFGITTDVIWLRLEVKRAPLADEEWWLELAPAYIGEATLYQLNGHGELTENPGSHAGIMLPLSTRNFKMRHSTFRIFLNDGEPKIFFIRVRSNAQLNVRGYLWKPTFFAEKNASENLVLGIYYGTFSLIVGICGVRFWINRKRADFWWLVYLISEGFFIFRMNGLASQYFFPELPALNAMASTVALGLMLFAGSNFGIHAFSLGENNHRYSYYAEKGIGGLALVFGFMRLINLEPVSTICLFLLSLFLCALNFGCAYRFLKSGEPSARFYFTGIFFMTACAMLIIARNFGIAPAYQFIDYIWQSNMIVHACLISFGMILGQRETSSERLRAEEYKESATLSQKYSNLQKRMVTLVSHEFRNSLAMLGTSMHVIRKRNDLPIDVVERHRNITRIHHQMRIVIDNFLLEERIQNANIRVNYERTEMSTLIRDVVNIAQVHGKGQAISSDCKDLPEFLWLDQGILRLVLTNLLDNAVTYSEPRSEIKLRGDCSNGFLKMSVSDNGIGMTEDSLARLCEPHFKADRNTEGIGIGLYMVRVMLHAHDGDMRIESKIGRGSTLEFRIKVRLNSDISANCGTEIQVSH